MANKEFAVPWKALRVDEDEHCFILDVDKNTLESAPGFDKDNWPQAWSPVELKSGACPRSGPHAAHVAQLMTHCVLVEDALARPVPYGVLH